MLLLLIYNYQTIVYIIYTNQWLNLKFKQYTILLMQIFASSIPLWGQKCW